MQVTALVLCLLPQSIMNRTTEMAQVTNVPKDLSSVPAFKWWEERTSSCMFFFLTSTCALWPVTSSQTPVNKMNGIKLDFYKASTVRVAEDPSLGDCQAWLPESVTCEKRRENQRGLQQLL